MRRILEVLPAQELAIRQKAYYIRFGNLGTPRHTVKNGSSHKTVGSSLPESIGPPYYTPIRDMILLPADLHPQFKPPPSAESGGIAVRLSLPTAPHLDNRSRGSGGGGGQHMVDLRPGETVTTPCSVSARTRASPEWSAGHIHLPESNKYLVPATVSAHVEVPLISDDSIIMQPTNRGGRGGNPPPQGSSPLWRQRRSQKSKSRSRLETLTHQEDPVMSRLFRQCCCYTQPEPTPASFSAASSPAPTQRPLPPATPIPYVTQGPLLVHAHPEIDPPEPSSLEEAIELEEEHARGSIRYDHRCWYLQKQRQKLEVARRLEEIQRTAKWHIAPVSPFTGTPIPSPTW